MEPSLNITDLVPLIDDRDPQALFDEWLSAVQAADPAYVPVNGSLDTIIAEALCLTVADLIYAVNRLPGVVTESVLALNDIPRYPGTRTTGQVTLTLDSVRTLTIPFDTRLMIDGLEYAVAVTTTATADSITVPVISVEMSSLGNGVPPGTGVDLLDPQMYVVAAQTTGVFSGGTDPEDDTSYKARAALVFSRMTSALLLPGAFTAYTAGLIDVSRAATVDLWDPDSGNDPGEDAGHITVFVHGYGAALPEARLTEIQQDLDDRSAANLTVHVMPVTLVTVNIDITVRLAPGVSASIVLGNVETALRSAISPTSWTWGENVTPEELAAIAARVNGVDYTLDVTTPADPVELPLGSLPTVGTLNVEAG